MERVAAAVEPLGLEPRRLEQLKTAVSEAAMNAIEHGNAGREELPVEIEVAAADGVLSVRITRRGPRPARSARPRRRTSTPSSRGSRSRAAGGSS